MLTEKQVEALLSYEELIPAIRRALMDFSGGRVRQPLRHIIPVPEYGGWFGVMPAVYGTVMGAKMVAFYPGNANLQKHTHMAMIQLFRADTGESLAVMDGRLITEMRTAAVSAAVTKYLAAPDAHVLALVGSGVQAHAHLQALSRVRQFDEIRVWSRTAAHAACFAEQYDAKAMPIADAVRGADVIVTATNALQPIVQGDWLEPGAHVNAVGSPRPNWRELDDRAMANILVVDSREAVLKESGDVILSGAEIYAEAGEIFARTKAAPFSETTVFKSVGLAIEDMATAKLVYDNAAKAATV